MERVEDDELDDENEPSLVGAGESRCELAVLGLMSEDATAVCRAVEMAVGAEGGCKPLAQGVS